ncbi:MAG TPA: helix-turn-helix domain-containing protein [Pyrinomonadaceae bacterium]|jgi:cytoskeletal protein RodZ
MSETLGEKLRQAREARGISISEVAEQTRISPHYIELIENDDYRTLPGGIFNKGFVKSYAKFIGIDEAEALQDYSQLISSQSNELTEEPKTYRPEVLTDDRSRSSILPTLIFAAIILGLMTVGILALVNYLKSEPTIATTNNTNQKNTNVAVASETPANTVNTNSAQALPATDEIKLEFKSLADVISVSSTVDGKLTNENVTKDNPKTYTGQQNVKIGYYKGFANQVQLTLNGKQITPPAAPPRGNAIVFEINKNNIAQILQSGQIQTGATNAAAPR